MARKRLHKFDYKGTDRFVMLEPIYANISEQTGISLVTDAAEGGKPASVTELVREGSLVKLTCSVVPNQDLTGVAKTRTIYADIDNAEVAVGSVRTKLLPAFGTRDEGYISSARVKARRRQR